MRIAGAVAAICALSGAVAEAQEIPALEVEAVAAPAFTERTWATGLAPNTRGGWTWVGQFMNYIATAKNAQETLPLPNGGHHLAYKDTKARPEAEWVVADLDKGTYKVVTWPGFNSNNLAGGALAGNGRLFFAVDYAQIYYYDPAEDTVKPLGRVCDDIHELRSFYQFRVGPDGMIYGTSYATNGLTQLIRLNPDTLEYKLYPRIGIPGRRKDMTYGYSLAVDSPWMYVAVGQGNWELFAVNADTGEQKCLADVTGDDCRITVGQGKDVCTAKVTSKAGAQSYLLAGGKAVPAGAANPPGTKQSAQVEWKNTKPMDISKPPELDKARPVEVGGRAGEGDIFWRPAGSTGEWKDAHFALKNCEPVPLESLIALPDGSLLGSASQYNGFFRYYPAQKKLDYFGKRGPSQARSVVSDGKVWFCGYPNTNLSVYDPAQPWTGEGKRIQDPKANPSLIGYFGQGTTEAHHCRFLLAPGNGRIYLCGDRERWSTGTGLGYYEIAGGKKFGLGTANKEIQPSGFIALPKLNRLVFSGSVAAGEAKLIVYDLNLSEVERIALKPGLTDTGRLYNADSDNEFLGCYDDPATKKATLYLYDLAQKRMVKSVELAGAPGPVLYRAADRTWWMLTDQTLNRLDPKTLELKPVGRIAGGINHCTWAGKELYGTAGGEVVHVAGAGLLNRGATLNTGF